MVTAEGSDEGTGEVIAELLGAIDEVVPVDGVFDGTIEVVTDGVGDTAAEEGLGLEDAVDVEGSAEGIIEVVTKGVGITGSGTFGIAISGNGDGLTGLLSTSSLSQTPTVRPSTMSAPSLSWPSLK